MSRTVRRIPLLAAVLIVTVLTACDNVDWGGTDVMVVPPPPRAGAEADTADVPTGDRLPEGPVLFHVATVDGGASVSPIAEITGDSLRSIGSDGDADTFARRFIAAYLREGTELALFRRGARVGTLAIQSATMPAAAACPALPRATGVPELVPGAGDESEFLALAKSAAPDIVRQPFTAVIDDRRLRFTAPIVGERVLRARNAPLPNNWQQALAQVVPFPTPEAERPAFAATLLVGDTLGPGLDAEGHSLFLIGEPTDDDYAASYIRLTRYEVDGRAAPGVVDVLDWDRDDSVELLLRVYGTDAEWFEAVGHVDGEWRTIYRSVCADQRPPTATPDTITENENEA